MFRTLPTLLTLYVLLTATACGSNPCAELGEQGPGSELLWLVAERAGSTVPELLACPLPFVRFVAPCDGAEVGLAPGGPVGRTDVCGRPHEGDDTRITILLSDGAVVPLLLEHELTHWALACVRGDPDRQHKDEHAWIGLK